jgi:hypothetical protein
MTAEKGEHPTQEPAETRRDKPLPDAAHLDEDAEALEDPVHSGDAIHQHEQHELHEQRPTAG